ncbi:hypothetical protein BKA93DRAFT_364432 [Sparassis latifolia]
MPASFMDPLNDDILDEIISYIEPQKVFPFMMSCKNFYAAALPRLLSELRLSYSSWGTRRLYKYCDFMLAKPSDRIPHLKKLTILNNCFHSGSTASLAIVIRQATHLQSLSIQMSTGSLASYPGLVHALRALPDLQYLNLSLDLPSAYEVLPRMTSHPREIVLSHFDNPYKPDELLQSCVNSLQVLRISGLSVFRTGSLVWPLVHTLEVGCLVDISQLSHAFPAVRRLVLSLGATPSWSDELDIAWMDLDHIHYDSSLVALFPCNVRRLDLCNWGSYPHVVSYVQRCSPIVLSCMVTDIGECFAQIAQAASHVQFLSIRGSFQHSRNRLFEKDLAEHMHLLGGLSLFGLSLVGATNASTPSRALDSVYQELAKQVAANIPSLEYIIIGGRRYRCTFHARSRAEGNLPEVEQLSESLGHVIERQLLDRGRS